MVSDCKSDTTESRVEQDCCVCFAQGGLSRICNPAPLNIRTCNPKNTVLTFFPHHRCSYSMVSDCKSDTTESRVEQDCCVCFAQVGLSRICNPAPLSIRICNPRNTVLTFFPHLRCSYSMVSDCKSDTTESRVEQDLLCVFCASRVEQDCCVCFAQGGLSRICNPAPLNIRICNPRYPALTFFRITDAHIQWCRIANPTQLMQQNDDIGLVRPERAASRQPGAAPWVCGQHTQTP